MFEVTLGKCVVRLVRDDITTLDVDGFVFNARPDLLLGAGVGTAVAVRGGPSIQAELKTRAPLGPGEAIVTAAGKLKARCIVHVVGPRFQEEDLERRLGEAIANALRAADANGIRRLALPALGVGFYGVPLDTCARVTGATLSHVLRAASGLEELIVCVRDTHEIASFERELRTVAAPAEARV